MVHVAIRMNNLQEHSFSCHHALKNGKNRAWQLCQWFHGNLILKIPALNKLKFFVHDSDEISSNQICMGIFWKGVMLTLSRWGNLPSYLSATIVVAQVLCLTIFNLSRTLNAWLSTMVIKLVCQSMLFACKRQLYIWMCCPNTTSLWNLGAQARWKCSWWHCLLVGSTAQEEVRRGSRLLWLWRSSSYFSWIELTSCCASIGQIGCAQLCWHYAMFHRLVWWHLSISKLPSYLCKSKPCCPPALNHPAATYFTSKYSDELKVWLDQTKLALDVCWATIIDSYSKATFRNQEIGDAKLLRLTMSSTNKY